MADDIKKVTYDVPVAAGRTTRRRNRTLKGGAGVAQGAVTKPKVVPTPTIPVAQAAGDPLPMLSTTRAVGGKAAPAAAAKTVAVPQNNVAKVVSAGPSKKTALKVPLPYNNSPKVAAPSKPAPVVKPAVKIVKEKPVQTRKEAKNKVKINPEKRKNLTLKRKFAAKKIMVKIENSSKIRKTRDAIRRKVANMEIKEVTEKLVARDLIKANSKVPEEMRRNMLIDVMMFPVPM
jgi:hypothetical protein